jgi:hypothetical protein
MANAISDARAAGLPATFMSGYREGSVTGSKYDRGGFSSHGYGLATDVGGIGAAGSKTAQQWNAIAQANGLHNPYLGTKAEGKEWNHWQLPELPLEQMPDQLTRLRAAKASGDINQVWAASKPFTSDGTMVASAGNAPIGVTINAASAPIAGALAQGQVTADPRLIVYNKLTAAGLQPHQALGALWSLSGESGAGLNPNAYNPKDPGGAVGIGQWIGPRRAAIEAFAKARGTAVTDLNTQADFLVDELTNNKAATYQPGVFAKMQGAKSAEDATRVWTSQFERPKVDNSTARIKGGTNVASLDDKGNFVLGKGGGGGGGGGGGTAVASAAPAAAPAEQSIWDKLTGPQLDKEGKPIAGAKSPVQQLGEMASSRLAAEGQKPQDEAPPQSALGQGPGARNVSPGLMNVAQTYGQTLNSFSQPLTWGSAPVSGAGMPAAGLRQAAAPAPGITLNSFQPSSQDLGYGIPDLGYGFG